jgi:hypothetical protein
MAGNRFPGYGIYGILDKHQGRPVLEDFLQSMIEVVCPTNFGPEARLVILNEPCHPVVVGNEKDIEHMTPLRQSIITCNALYCQ